MVEGVVEDDEKRWDNIAAMCAATNVGVVWVGWADEVKEMGVERISVGVVGDTGTMARDSVEYGWTAVIRSYSSLSFLSSSSSSFFSTANSSCSSSDCSAMAFNFFRLAAVLFLT
ncbi:hypothetical protein ACLOJK_037336 [Asimina triloba]